MKPGPATSTLAISVVGAQLFGDQLGQLARLLARILGQHHRGIGRHVAMAGVARRLDQHARRRRAPAALRTRSARRSPHARGRARSRRCWNSRSCRSFRLAARALSQLSPRKSKPAYFGNSRACSASAKPSVIPAMKSATRRARAAASAPSSPSRPLPRHVVRLHEEAGEQGAHHLLGLGHDGRSRADGGTCWSRGTP